MKSRRLKPALGPFELFFYATGVIIGAGVYSVIGAAAGLAQSKLWLSFLIGAVIALLTALSYAEMATAFPVAGGEYVYARRALPRAKWLSFTLGMIIIIGGCATAATVAVSFGGYLASFVAVPLAVSAIAVLALCTLVAVLGIRQSSWANIVFTVVEIGGLFLIIAVAFVFTSETAPPASLSTGPPNALAAAAILFFVYLGFEEVANVAEEARNPSRDIPRALFWSLGVTTVLYILVGLAVLKLASPEQLASSGAPLATALENAWPQATTWLSAIALFATANTVLITLIATARVMFSMGRDGELPAVFGAVSSRRTPWVASLLVFAMAALLVPIGDIQILAGLSSFSALLAFLAVNLALVVLRYVAPETVRPFRVPLNLGRLPLLPVAAIASIAFLLGHFDRQVYFGGALAIAGSILIFFVRAGMRRRAGPAGAGPA
jgi:basic amino acid/polyamine antiporter, APA family